MYPFIIQTTYFLLSQICRINVDIIFFSQYSAKHNYAYLFGIFNLMKNTQIILNCDICVYIFIDFSCNY